MVIATPTDALQADVVFTMLADDAAIRAVLLAPGVLQSATIGIIQVVTATIPPEFADELSAFEPHDRDFPEGKEDRRPSAPIWRVALRVQSRPHAQ